MKWPETGRWALVVQESEAVGRACVGGGRSYMLLGC